MRPSLCTYFRTIAFAFPLFITVSASGQTAPCTEIRERSPGRPSTKVIISDLHLGPGRREGKELPLEDFRFSSTFAKFLDSASRDTLIDLVIAGDFIDFWQVKPELNGMKGPTEDESVSKIEEVWAQHQETFTTLTRFLEAGNRVIIVPGNHDADLLWPRVQEFIRDKIKNQAGSNASANLFFAAPCYRGPALHVEHGHQRDFANKFANPAMPMVGSGAARRLETNWGTTFVYKFYNQVEMTKPFIDNLRPSLAAALWAVRNEPPLRFSIPQIGKLLVMVLRDQDALDNLGYIAYKLGPQETKDRKKDEIPEKSVDNLLKIYEKADPEFAKPFKEIMDSVEERSSATEELSQMSDSEWLTVQNVVKKNPTLSTSFRDPYVAAARSIVLHDNDVYAVVMGHTHDLERTEITVIPDLGPLGSNRWYVNTGCWQRSLSVKRARANWRWEDLDLNNLSMFPDRFSYVTITYDDKGKFQKPSRSFWPEQ